MEIDLINQYNDTLRLEEEFWKLKSCVNWLQHGDANTKFFHLTTLQRRRRNKITALKYTGGNWIFEQTHINELIQSYYKNLFTTTHTHSNKNCLMSPYNSISNEDQYKLASALTKREITTTIDFFKPLKAPGPDELHPYFYQIYWALIANSIISFLQSGIQYSTHSTTNK